ncbi:hypothetical protein EMCRGX_G005750 [Ephydatia muelleri]
MRGRQCLQAPDGFDAVSVQNVGSTYIIVSWDCQLTVMASSSTSLQHHRPPPLHFVHVHVLQSRPQALHSSWNVVLGVISAAAAQHEKDSPPGGPPDPELDTNDIVISIFINKIINLTSPLAPQTPCASFYNSPLELLVEHTAPHIHDSNKYCCLCWPWGLTATTKPTRAVQGVNNHCPG